MSETDEKDPTPKPETGEGKGDDKDLQAEVAKWKELARKNEQRAKENLEAAKKLKEMEDAGKSEIEKAAAKAAEAEKRAQDAELRALRLEVATSKGLSSSQAKRLVGATKEELEADADEFLESIRPDDSGKPPGGKPKEALHGGGDPSEEPEEMDPRKLAEMVPRSY